MSKLFPTVGTDKFPATVNEFYNMIEGIISQKINAATLNNTLSDSDAFFFYDCKEATGRTIEESIVKAAESRGFVPVMEGTDHDSSPKDPTIYTKYFKHWDKKQFLTTVRLDDVRAVIKNKGAGVEELVAKIINSLTEGDNGEDFENRRAALFNAPVVDFASINGNRSPKTLDGVITIIRDMYNHVKGNNADCTDPAFKCAVPDADIRVAMSERLINLIGVTTLANMFNLKEAELFGTIVPVHVDDLDPAQWWKVVVYDRHAMNVAEYILDYTQEPYYNSRYSNHALTVEREYFYNSLFKACAIDCSVAANAKYTEIFGEVTSFNVTKTLNSVCTLSNPATKVNKNMVYMTKVVPVVGKKIEELNVVVTMGSDITENVYSVVDGVGQILIPAATQAFTIAVTSPGK